MPTRAETPSDFARFVGEVAAEAGFPPERIVLGGDHLGPHAWQGESAGAAMAKARDLVRHWKKYYRGDEADLRYARKYSYSDRARCYWPHPGVQGAPARLVSNLSGAPIPLPLLSQHLPAQYAAVREGRIRNEPAGLIHDKITEVLDPYAFACGMSPNNPTSWERRL